MPTSSERDFELAFAELAFAALQDRAPSIVPKVVGFQVLDAADDQAHAVGVFGADVAEQMVYIPAFFHSGEIKGLETMYLSEQDVFVPMRDNWIAYLVTRRPTDLGDNREMPRNELGRIAYSLSRLRRSPSASKMSSAPHRLGTVRGRDVYASWGPGVRFLPALAIKSARSTRDGTDLSRLDLVSVLSDLHPSATTFLAKMAGANRAVMQALTDHYGDDGVGQMLTSARFRAKMAASAELSSVDPVVLENQRVEVTSYEQLEPGEFAGLTEEQRRELMRGEFVVRDGRERASRLYRSSFKITLSTPQRTGVYDVPTDDGMVRCLIGISPIYLSDPANSGCLANRSSNRLPKRRRSHDSHPITGASFRSMGPDYAREPLALVAVNLDGEGAVIGPIESLVVNDSSLELSKSVADRGVSPTSMQEGKRYVLVDAAGHCTEPFTFAGMATADDGSTVLSVHTGMYPCKSNGDACWRDPTVEIDCLPIRGTIAHASGRVMVPCESTTAVEVKVKDYGYNAEGRSKANYAESEHGGFPRVLSPEQLDVAMQAADMTPITVRGSGRDYRVTIGRSSEKSASLYGEREALSYLVSGLGLRGGLAKSLLAEAQELSKQAGQVRGWVEFAPGYPAGAVKQGYFVPPPMPVPDSGSELGVPAVHGEQIDEVISGLEAANYDQSGYDLSKYVGRGASPPGVPAAQAVASAAATGQKDVFDTAAVATLTKAYDSGELTDRYLPDVILGMDRIGRIYFLLLKHFDQFRDRYGAQDAVRLEDSLRNAFRLVGDLVMDLKERDIGSNAGSPDEVRA